MSQELINIKRSILHMTCYSRSSHVGSCLSIADILYTLYFKVMHITPSTKKAPDRDRFILSKAHGSAALYATLAEAGFFPKEYLEHYFVDNGRLPGHLDREILDCLETSGGSLGHGLSLGVGMALASRVNKTPGHTYVLLGDGECNEGSVWEAVMLASTLQLSNLTAIIDYNKLQSFGRTNEIIDQKNMAERWQAFGWAVSETDGHTICSLEKALKERHTRPHVIIAHTIKGKGASFMEDRLEWHYKSPTPEQCDQAYEELKRAG